MTSKLREAIREFGLEPYLEHIVAGLGVERLADFAILQFEDLAVLNLKPVQCRKLWQLCESLQGFVRAWS
jgi:hypothetical protein